MPTFNKKLIGTGILWVAFGVGCVFGVRGIQSILRQDPMADYRGRGGAPPIAIQFQDVSIKTYEGARLVAQAKIGEIQVGRDRRGLTLIGIKSGSFFSAEGQSFRFSASNAHYHTGTRVFEATNGAHVVNRDLDIKSASFRYSDSEGMIKIPGDITGTYLKGNIKAKELAYNVKSDDFTLGPVSWTGKLPQEGAAQAPRRWDIRAESGSRTGDTETFVTGRATDGEIIVKADTISRNVKTDVLVAVGNVRYFAKDMNLLCDRVTVFRKEKRAILEGSVQAFIKPDNQQKLEETELQPLRPIVPPNISEGRPDAPPTRTDADKKLDSEVRSGENRRKYPVVATAERIEYWYARGSRRAVITGNPRAQQDMPGGRWRRMSAPIAKWNGEKDLLRCESSPGQKDTVVETSLGDRVTATWFEVSTKEGNDSWAAAGIDGVFIPEDDDLNNRGTTGGGGGVTAPPPGMQGPIGGRNP